LASFADLDLSAPIMRAIEQMGFEATTPIQAKAIPVALTGRDLIGQAQTGTGKTVAFAIPMIEAVDTASPDIQGLILTPTRELCIQVAEELARVGKFKRIRTLPVYGGQDIGRQLRALRNHPHVIIATPGRLLDHLNRGTIKLDSVRVSVLDEADEMLDMGFIEDIETILGKCPTERQTLLFSATMKPGVRELARKFLRNSELITTQDHQVTLPTIEQMYYEVRERQKLDLLTRLFDIHNPELAIVFGRTKRRVDELLSALQTRGYMADGIHGDLSQRQRDAVMQKFREGNIEILVATDVAARGIDVSGVTHVFNFDMPQDIDSYVHRIGRTGRAGKEGIASTFVTPREVDYLHQIERVTKQRIAKQPMPTFSEAMEGKQRVAMEQLVEVIESDEFGGFKSMAEELLEDHDSISVVAAALKLMTKDTKEVPIQLTEEQPARARRAQSTGRRDSGGGGRRDGSGRRDGGRRDGHSSGRRNGYMGDSGSFGRNRRSEHGMHKTRRSQPNEG
jgi:ATP-dependent RNA helicase DeaD